jgi:hypothetical protein
MGQKATHGRWGVVMAYPINVCFLFNFFLEVNQPLPIVFALLILRFNKYINKQYHCRSQLTMLLTSSSKKQLISANCGLIPLSSTAKRIEIVNQTWITAKEQVKKKNKFI